MRYSTQIKPIRYVKAHAAELLGRIAEEREPIITQNGEARRCWWMCTPTTNPRRRWRC
jgi:hypothetical protein